MGAWENRGGGGGADMVVEGERARGESLTWWEPARRNRGNYTTMLKEGRKQEERGRSCKVCTPIPTPPPPPTPQFGNSRGSFYHLSHISYSKLIKLNGPIGLASGDIVCLTLKLTDNKIIM